MRTVRLQTDISAPSELCFDLALDLEEHARSASQTRERVVHTTAQGHLRLNDEVTFEARHFGVRWRMTARVTGLERPASFVDEQVRGPFRSFRHEHRFEPTPDGTRMTDEFRFEAPLPWLTERLIAGHLEPFLRTRAAYLKGRAEQMS